MSDEERRDDETLKKSKMQEERSFVREQLKKQPFFQRRAVRRILTQVLIAVICGVVACFAFVMVHPWMEDVFGREEPSEITLDDEEDEPSQDADDFSDSGEDGSEVSEEEPEVSAEISDEGTGEQDAADDAGEDVEEVYEPLEFTAEEFGNLYDSLDELITNTSYSLVTVTASETETDLFGSTYGGSQEISGILVGNNGVELLILVSYSSVSGVSDLSAEFVDGTDHDAVLKTYDVVSNLAILSVNLSDVTDDTLTVIQMADLGSSRYMKAGDPVIALGSPAGIADSVKYGNLVSSSYSISVIDGEYTLLITDITASSNASGVLINLDGQVVGLIEDTYLQDDNTGVLTAYGISQMKGIIENLSNSQDVVYMGITGMQVTQSIADSEGIPLGVYVSSVEQDSPALSAGIQAGDIITEINGNTVYTMSDIQEMLLLYSNEQVIQVNVMRQGKEEYKEIGCKVTLSVLR